MQTGKLRSRVRFQSASTTPDGQGGVTKSWVDQFTVWASVSGTGGRTFQTAKQSRATLTDEVRIRYRSGITPDMRLIVGARVLKIAQPPIDVESRHREMVLLCEEIVGETP